MAFESGRANLANSNIPSLKALPESDLADMEYFLIQTQLILPTVGFDFLRPKPSLLVPESSVSRLGGSGGLIGTSPLLKFVNRNGVDASAMDLDGEVVVFKGSHGISQEFTQNDYKNLRDQLIRDGRIMMRADGRIEFQEDVIFHSASAAAAVLANRNSNGLTEWKIAETGQTLKAWRDEQLMAVSLSSSSN
jgi:hypothetical protein